jgi:hypothetical protein
MVSSFFEWFWKLFTLLLVLSGCAVISKSESFLSGQDLNLNCSLVSNRVMLDVTITIDANKAKADLSERNTRAGTHILWEDLQGRTSDEQLPCQPIDSIGFTEHFRSTPNQSYRSVLRTRKDYRHRRFARGCN